MKTAVNTGRSRKIKEYLSCYLMCGLPIIGFLVFSLVPLVISLYLSFTQLYTLNFTSATFIGLENFATLFTDPLFGKAIVTTLYAMISIPLSMVLGLLIAQLLTRKSLKGKKFFRTLFFIPYVCSTVAVTLVFKWMFDAEFGIINDMFQTKISFFLDERWFMPVMILLTTWTGTGYYIILFQAALTSVNRRRGANSQIFRHHRSHRFADYLLFVGDGGDRRIAVVYMVPDHMRSHCFERVRLGSERQRYYHRILRIQQSVRNEYGRGAGRRCRRGGLGACIRHFASYGAQLQTVEILGAL